MGLDLHYQVFGEGEPLLMLHGLFGSLSNWRPIAKRLAEQFRVYTLDLRNHGRSPHAETMSYADMVGDLLTFTQQQQLSAFYLLGHSMGGKVAMLMALQAADRVKKLVVVDIAPVTYAHDFDHMITAMKGLDLSRLRNRTQADVAMAEQVKVDGVRQFLLQNLVLVDNGYQWRIHLPAIEQNLALITGFPETSSVYAGSTLFIAGALSDYIGAIPHPAITRYFPAARIETIEQAGHWLHAEQPDAFVQTVTSFLR